VGLAVGGAQVGGCFLATTVNFCVPSFLLSVSERRRASNKGTVGACPRARVIRRSRRHAGNKHAAPRNASKGVSTPHPGGVTPGHVDLARLLHQRNVEAQVSPGDVRAA
jgi:hypothetical protein